MSARPAEHLVHGLTGPVVVVSGRSAALLLAHGGLDRYHQTHRGADPELDAVLVALKLASAAWRAGVTDPGHQHPHRRYTAHPHGLSTTDAATRLGCSPRTIRRACANGNLPAAVVGGSWVIDATELEHYRARRGTTKGHTA